MPGRSQQGRVILVISPLGRVGGDVIANCVQIVFVADDMLIIIALPDGLAGVKRAALILREESDLKF